MINTLIDNYFALLEVNNIEIYNIFKIFLFSSIVVCSKSLKYGISNNFILIA
jgi:hypothetical protein